MAYARKLLEHVNAGDPVRLVVVSLRDWQAGRMMEERAGVLRLVVPPDASLVDLDWSVLYALDVLVIGGELPEMTTAMRLAFAAGASTVWGDYDEGLERVEPCGYSVVALDLVRHIDELLDVLPGIRLALLLRGAGVFSGLAFLGVRIAAFGAVFGAGVADKLRARYADKVAA